VASTRPERGALAVAVVLVLAALGARPVMARVWPGRAVAAAVVRGGGDPWGNGFSGLVALDGSRFSISHGPDGVPSEDDLLVVEVWTKQEPVPGGAEWVVRRPWLDSSLAFLREAFAAAALLVAWCVLAPFRRTPRAPTVARELPRALVLASLPAVVTVGLVYLVFGRIWIVGLRPWDALEGASVSVVAPRHAAGLSLLLAWVLVALGWRLSRPLEDAAPSPSS
jgi:hypothetical protein